MEGNVSQTSERDPEKQPLLKAQEEDIPINEDYDTDNACAWMIALGLSFVNFMTLGMSRINSKLFVDFMDEFHVQRKAASVPYSLQQSVTGLFGPVVGFMGQRFGISTVNILGAIVAAASSGACYFAEDMTFISVLWGAVYGFGVALTGPVKLILLDQYFIKNKSSASGLVFAGASLGAILLPVILDKVSQKYGIHGMFLLIGSITLYIIPVAMFFREKKKSETPMTKTSIKRNTNYNTLSENKDHSDTLSNSYMVKEKESLKISAPLSSQKTILKLTNEEVLEGPSTKKPSINSDENLSIPRVMHIDKNGSKSVNPHHKFLNVYENGENKTVCVKFIETKCCNSSNDDYRLKQADKCSKAQSLKESIPFEEGSNDIAISDNFQEVMPSSVLTKKYENGLHYLEKDSVNSTIHEKQSNQNFKSNFEEQKRDIKIGVLEKSERNDGESSAHEILETSINYKKIVDFKVLHENIDVVLSVLIDKSPLTDEEWISSSSEILQSTLESSDSEFVLKELQKIECHFQRPCVEMQKFLFEIQEKFRNFTELLNADRNQFRNEQEDISMEGKQLAYKSIHHKCIRKPQYTLEITEYSLDVPVELYIPFKLQEISLYEASVHQLDERIVEVLKELRKLHESFNMPFVYVRNSSKINLLQTNSYNEINEQSTKRNPTEEYQSTFKNQIGIALRIHINPMFLIVCLSRGLFALTFLPVVISVVDFVMDHGMLKSDGIYAIIVLYIGDLIGRLCTGWITDKGFMSDKNYMVVALMLLGVSTATLPFMSGMVMLLPALGLFALLEGSLFMKHPIMLMKYLKSYEKYIGLGFVNFFAGIMGLTIPSYIGYFRDTLGSYDILLYINGCLSAFIGFLWILEPFFIRFVPVCKEMNAL